MKTVPLVDSLRDLFENIGSTHRNPFIWSAIERIKALEAQVPTESMKHQLKGLEIDRNYWCQEYDNQRDRCEKLRAMLLRIRHDKITLDEARDIAATALRGTK